MEQTFDIKNLKEIIKATLFISGEGVQIASFSEKLNVTSKQVTKAVEELQDELKDSNGIQLIKYKDKIQLCSNPDYAEQIADILNPIREKALTKAALETMAIIAYKQPITKLEIEEIRGVGCDYTVQILTENNLIEVVGRKDVIGRPLLYGTTDEFLKRFQISSIENLSDNEELLERLKLIQVEYSESLYNNFKVPDEEIVPEFLKDENDLETISADEKIEIKSDSNQEDEDLEDNDDEFDDDDELEDDEEFDDDEDDDLD